jgi:predicted Zn finger-like uncharacterized protein
MGESPILNAEVRPVIHFQCPRCQASFQCPDDKAGIKGNCPKCGQRLQIPSPPPNKTILAPLASPPAIPAPATPPDFPPARKLLSRWTCFFAGLSTPDAAAALSISVATAERWWTFAPGRTASCRGSKKNLSIREGVEPDFTHCRESHARSVAE